MLNYIKQSKQNKVHKKKGKQQAVCIREQYQRDPKQDLINSLCKKYYGIERS